MKPCDENIQKTIDLTGEMIRLADGGDSEREDPGCGILYGILRDSAYKIRKEAEKEKAAHIRKGWWVDEVYFDVERAAVDEMGSIHKKNGDISQSALNRSYGEHLEHRYRQNSENISGSKTEKNLMAAFAQESQTCNRYLLYASGAEKEGFQQISSIFIDTANQEKEHAGLFLSRLNGGEIKITLTFSAAGIGTTLENLKSAAGFERREHEDLYPGFAAVAAEEGFGMTADIFKAVATAEKHHEKRFKALAQNLENNTVFHKNTRVLWRCINCGYTGKDVSAPFKCPACEKSQAFFEVLKNNW